MGEDGAERVHGWQGAGSLPHHRRRLLPPRLGTHGELSENVLQYQLERHWHLHSLLPGSLLLCWLVSAYLLVQSVFSNTSLLHSPPHYFEMLYLNSHEFLRYFYGFIGRLTKISTLLTGETILKTPLIVSVVLKNNCGERPKSF
ncbi:hypothetical protein E2C01_094740 [Portunus trituberculatus]|uniref:Uncharacterized protein n=1 Tax=Portunus trituberculatus TaxID=210409 RepID=A0A5B7JY10_PORTR|nr:hypothetical protein [Portunus trituberculatus]